MRPLMTVGGYPLPDPSEYIPGTADFVDGARNLEAEFVGAVVGQPKSRVELNYRFLHAQVWSDILKQFNRRVEGRFVASCTFFDQDFNDWRTTDMYVSDRTSQGMFWRDPNDGNVRGWRGCRLALIEV